MIVRRFLMIVGQKDKKKLDSSRGVMDPDVQKRQKESMLQSTRCKLPSAAVRTNQRFYLPKN